MKSKYLQVVTALSLGLLLACGGGSDDSKGGDGGKGGSGGKGSGGSGGSGSGGKGGSGGTSAGGSGGTSSGGSGGTGSGGSASGGAGGVAAGGSGGTAAGGAGGGATGPYTVGFEESPGAWKDAGEAGQCDHGRLKIVGAPVLSDVEKKSGSKSLAFEIDMDAALKAYTALCPAKAAKDAHIGIELTGGDVTGFVALATKGSATPGTLPVGTVIEFNVKTALSANFYVIAQVDGVARNDLFGLGQTSPDQWVPVTATLAKAIKPGFGWQELALLFVAPSPATFKGKVYIDDIKVTLP